MPRLGNLSACVHVDGTQSPEYAVQYSADGKRATCWIASEAGKNFTVSWKATYTTPYLPFAHKGALFVDGTPCTSRILRQHGLQHESNIRGIDTSPTTQRSLVFSKMELTDDDVYLHVVSSELGDIKLEMSEVLIVSRGPAVRGASTPQLTQKVHERSKKGSTHCVNFGAEFQQQRFTTTRTRTIRHLCTFIFKYRPLDILQANGISPAPDRKRKHTAVADEILDLTLDDDDDVKEEPFQESKKFETQDRAPGSNKRIKTEVKTEPRNLIQLGEIIDLT